MQRINRPHPTTTHRRQRGITLIESLVALVISALAILGIVGVQMRTLADTQTAVRRAQAIRLIEDLSERMRVNPNALTQIANFESTFSDKDDEDKSLEIKNGCADGCEPEEQAAFDIASWKQTVRNLPLGEAQIFLAPGESDENNRRQLGVIISWRENEAYSKDDYLNPINSVTTAGGTNNDNACPEGRVCHLQYIPVPARCAPYGTGASIKYYCS